MWDDVGPAEVSALEQEGRAHDHGDSVGHAIAEIQLGLVSARFAEFLKRL